jgi:hypothetical protein
MPNQHRVFILTTVACMAGCIFKYTKLHARGLEVLPFIDNYRACYARIFSGQVCWISSLFFFSCCIVYRVVILCVSSCNWLCLQGSSSDPYQGVVYKSNVGPQAEFDAPISESASVRVASSSSSATAGSNPFSSYQSA